MAEKMSTELSVVFVLVGMMFLVPIITGEALASIDARVSWFPTLHEGSFVIVGSHLDDGKWVTNPTCSSAGTGQTCWWKTAGSGVLSGDEKGYVTVGSVTPRGDVKLWFSNPTSGQNKAWSENTVGIRVDSSISQGNAAVAKYLISPPGG